jgi:hypothetical protein
MATPLTVATVSAAAVENPVAASDAIAINVPKRLERDLNVMMSPLIALISLNGRWRCPEAFWLKLQE